MTMTKTRWLGWSAAVSVAFLTWTIGYGTATYQGMRRVEEMEGRLMAELEAAQSPPSPVPSCEPEVIQPGPCECDCDTWPPVECVGPKPRREKGKRDACMEIADAPPGTDDSTLRRVGGRAEHELRIDWPHTRFGLGTRARDRHRVIRFWQLDRRDAEAGCRFLDCLGWYGPTKDHPEVARYCKVLVGRACDY